MHRWVSSIVGNSESGGHDPDDGAHILTFCLSSHSQTRRLALAIADHGNLGALAQHVGKFDC